MLISSVSKINLISSAKLGALAINKQQAIIDPTTKADVVVHHKVEQCTTRHVGVQVTTSILIADKGSTFLDVSNDVISTVTVTVTNHDVVEQFVEHNE